MKIGDVTYRLFDRVLVKIHVDKSSTENKFLSFSLISKKVHECHFVLLLLRLRMRFTRNPTINSCTCGVITYGEQGWCSGESTRLPPMWPGFDSQTRRHMWVEFVAGSRPCSRGFSPGTPVFPSLQKPTFLNPNSICPN